MNATAVIDTADILLAQPITVAAGETIDFSGTALSVDFAPIRGGPVVMSASTADGTLAFVGGASPHFVIDLPVAGRAWRVARPTAVRGDILRRPDPSNPGRIENLGRIDLMVHPGSNSSAIALAAQVPVLIDIQPYDGRIVTAPMVVGPQGAPGSGGALPPIPVDAATNTYTLGLVQGAPAWALSSSQDFDLRRDGTGPAVVWLVEDGAGALLPMDGRAFTLSIRWDGGTIAKDTANTDGLTVDPAASTVTWTPTQSERLAIPVGRLAFYELACRTGAQPATIASGLINTID